jgi:hypothetical protein
MGMKRLIAAPLIGPWGRSATQRPSSFELHPPSPIASMSEMEQADSGAGEAVMADLAGPAEASGRTAVHAMCFHHVLDALKEGSRGLTTTRRVRCRGGLVLTSRTSTLSATHEHASSKSSHASIRISLDAWVSRHHLCSLDIHREPNPEIEQHTSRGTSRKTTKAGGGLHPPLLPARAGTRPTVRHIASGLNTRFDSIEHIVK